MRRSISILVPLALISGAVCAAPASYDVDVRHTHVTFAADHFGGLSVWRGLFSASAGKVVLDTAAQGGTVDITIDAASVLTGVADLDKHLKSGEFLDVAKFPTATYKGKLASFKNGAPTEVLGDLTLHGVTRPVKLSIATFKCMAHPMQKDKEVCGANAQGEINREEFGVAWGKPMGFDMAVRLYIQIEATRPK